MLTESKLVKKESIPEELLENITCPICSGIAVDPKQCAGCQRLFCAADADLCLKSKNSCPICRNKPWKLKANPHRIYKMVLDGLEFNCPCGQVVKYTNIQKHKYEQHLKKNQQAMKKKKEEEQKAREEEKKKQQINKQQELKKQEQLKKQEIKKQELQKLQKQKREQEQRKREAHIKRQQELKNQEQEKKDAIRRRSVQGGREVHVIHIQREPKVNIIQAEGYWPMIVPGQAVRLPPIEPPQIQVRVIPAPTEPISVNIIRSRSSRKQNRTTDLQPGKKYCYYFKSKDQIKHLCANSNRFINKRLAEGAFEFVLTTRQSLYFIDLVSMNITDINEQIMCPLQAEEYMCAVWRCEDSQTKEQRPFNATVCVTVEADYEQFQKTGFPKMTMFDYYGDEVKIDFTSMMQTTHKTKVSRNDN